MKKYEKQICGVCILWLMLQHGVNMDGVKGIKGLGWLFDILGCGYVAFDVFLFLAGIGLYRLFAENSDIKAYAKQRLSKILSPYLLIGGVYFVWHDLVKKHSVNKFLRNFSTLSFLFDGNKTVWFVFMLAFCSVIFPYLFYLIYKKGGNYREHGVLNGLLLIALIVGGTFCIKFNYPDAYDNISIAVTRLPIFIFGVLCAKPVNSGQKISPWWLVLAIGIVIAFYPVIRIGLFDSIYKKYYLSVFAACLTLVGAALFSVIKIKPLHSAAAWLGSAYYEIYLCTKLLSKVFEESELYGTHILWKYGALMIIAILLAKISCVFIKNFDDSTKIPPPTQLKKRERIVWIDQMRGVVFYLVVLGHTGITLEQFSPQSVDPNIIKTLIYAFHMPAFFFISGLTFDKDSITAQSVSSYAAKISKRLLIPYFWLSFMLLPYYFLLLTMTKGVSNSVLNDVIRGIFYSNMKVHQMPTGSMWFITALFLGLLLYQVVLKFVRGNLTAALPVMFVLAWLGFTMQKKHPAWCTCVAPLAAVFIYCGNAFMVLYKSGKLKKIMRLHPINIIVVIGITALGVHLSLINGKVSTMNNSYGNKLNSPWLYYLCALIGTFVTVYICEKLPKSKLITFIGQNTLVMLAIHKPIFRILGVIIPDLMADFWFKLAMSFAEFLLLIPISMIFNKFFPFAAGKTPKNGRTKFVCKLFFVFCCLIVPIYTAGQNLLDIRLRSWYMRIVFIVAVGAASAAAVFVLNNTAPVAFLEKSEKPKPAK